LHLPINLRRSFVRLALLSATSFAVGLFLPVYSSANQSTTRSVERAVQAEERAARHEEERTARAQEREAARNARSGEGSGETAAGQPPSEPATPSLGESERGCLPSIEASATRITAGEPVTLSGAVECPDPASAVGQQVPIYERQGPGAFSLVGTATTEADGAYSFTTSALSVNAVFQAREGRHRAHVAVRVGPGITLSILAPAAQASAATGQTRPQTRTRATFTGTVTPAVAGALVALQVSYAASGEDWHSVAYARVTAAGSYFIAHTFRTPGEASVRTIVHIGRHNAPAISEPLAYEVAQPQSPQLSIATSADPLIAEQSVTISGVAAGAAGQTVTLLTRSAGGAFVEVAKETTDASGGYTFTQTPLQSAYYRVTDATAQSTTLFVGVAFALASTAAPTTIDAGQPLTFSGTLTPAPVGQALYLESEHSDGVRFHVIAVGTVGSDFEYAIVHSFDSAGTNILRVTAPGDRQHQPSTSAPFTITVTG
jgi:hypothetical protein